MDRPSLELRTRRLVLRSFTNADAAALQVIAGERRIADTTISVPHPFTMADAIRWIEKAQRGLIDGTQYGFAIALPTPARLIGYAALHEVDREHAGAEVSFWIGAEFEGQGFVTEAAARVISFAFDEIGLNRLCAFHMVRNPGSGRVLEKLGFRQEGYLRHRVRKWGTFEDVLAWSLLRGDREAG
ncbi:GNAT family N-acetyltransferase [Methylobacterium nonmethylotrophicum]|uniref:N-acetyltransferase n=1 Tax=Methylobacterium nonmethylotrophicum TaxID=1141884 RepID=A0A4Z0NYZ6_9HYPH|nr:GNAT family N-acetyltransferase [Methylobacterium nonmethylotrophicum]TGE02262.1 N-acetyltransferase [Methylobacterium nonmethylotrophicum]